MFLQIAFIVCIFEDVRQEESGLQLSSYLILQRMGELYPAVRIFQLFHLIGIFLRIEGQRVCQHFFIVVKNIVDSGVKT